MILYRISSYEKVFKGMVNLGLSFLGSTSSVFKSKLNFNNFILHNIIYKLVIINLQKIMGKTIIFPFKILIIIKLYYRKCGNYKSNSSAWLIYYSVIGS